MLIGFVGDLHGHVFEALAAIERWQLRSGRTFDLLVQLGDFGVRYGSVDPADYPDDSYERIDPGQFDLTRMLSPSREVARALERVRGSLCGPILVIRGNHDDEAWLRAWKDPFGLFEFVPDATILTLEDVRIGFIGCPVSREDWVDAVAVDRLAAAATGGLDIIASHTGPYGVATGYRGGIYGAKELTALIERVQPRYFVSGDFHHVIGPLRFGRTMYYGLDGITSGRWDVRPGVSPGSIAVFDSEDASLSLVVDQWLGEIGGFGEAFDFASWSP